MPHIVVEYSANLRGAVADADLLAALSEAVLAQRGPDGGEIFPVLGLRARAIAYDEFRVADAAGSYGFVHVTIRIGAGRSEAVERATARAAFAVLKKRLGDPPGILVALSLDLERLGEGTSFKYNAIRERLGRDGRTRDEAVAASPV